MEAEAQAVSPSPAGAGRANERPRPGASTRLNRIATASRTTTATGIRYDARDRRRLPGYFTSVRNTRRSVLVRTTSSYAPGESVCRSSVICKTMRASRTSARPDVDACVRPSASRISTPYSPGSEPRTRERARCRRLRGNGITLVPDFSVPYFWRSTSARRG